MNCPYCHAQNDSDTHRCVRCGRRLNDDGPMFPVQTSAAVPVIDLQPREAKQPEVAPQPRPQIVRDLPKTAEPSPAPVGQQSLFGPMVVQKQTQAKPPRTASQPRRRHEPAAQQGAFNFGTHTLPTSVAAAVSCGLPVAQFAPRAVAAAIDAAIPIAGFGLFLATLHTAGNVVLEQSQMLTVYVTALAAITLLYRLLCCLGNMDSVGLQWAGLQLLHFHGHRPTRGERLRRLAGGVVSAGSLGMGLLWAIGDEERLTWHDYMSRTFPTSRFED